MKRPKRSKREILADVLGALIVHGSMNRHQLGLTANLKGRNAKAFVEDFVGCGLLEWTGEQSKGRGERYGLLLRFTERGRQWLDLWILSEKLMDPEAKLKVTVQRKEKK